MNSGVLIPEDVFVCCIKQIKCLSDELHDDWVLHGKENIEHNVYLSKKVYKTFQETNFEEHLESVLITFDYHVVYSVSYSAPVLCFNAWKTDGSLISLEESWKRLNVPGNEKFTTLTQMDHPVLMSPYLTLHPCKTAEVIGAFFEKSKNPVMSWLSTVAPVVNLEIMPEYAKLTY